MKTLQIDNTDIILQNYGKGKGKIIISDTAWGYDFSCYWGAMGSDIEEFLCQINSSYFVDKLSKRREGDFDPKKTFANLRKYIREELYAELPWYKHMEFQKDMREELKYWQNSCGSQEQFVYEWDSFFRYSLNYYLIEDRYDRKEIEESFQGIEEQWNFIAFKTPPENIWLEKLHKKMKKHLERTLETV